MATPRQRRSFLLTVVIFSIGYLSYSLSKIVFVVFAAPLVLVLVPFPNAKYRVLHGLTRAFLAFFARGWLPALGLYRIVEITGSERWRTAGPAVLAANHRGYMDSLLVLSLVPRLGVLVKSRYTRGPMYALLARHFDLISLDPARRSSVVSAVAQCRQLLAAGKKLLVYPEGARSRSGRLQPFNTLAFDLALEAGVPVVPVIVHSTSPFMAKTPGSLFPRDRNEYRIRFLDPETPGADDTAESLGDRVYRRLARELKALDVGTVWDPGRGMRHEDEAAV